MKYFLLFLILNTIVLISDGKKKIPFYPANLISSELTDNANSVIRSQKVVLEIVSKEKVKYSIKEIITVLNKNGDNQAVLYMPYDSNIKPEITDANIYDQHGELIKKVKKTEIYDQCYFDGFSLFSDARFKRITPQINNYPYTVEYEYSFQFNGIIDYPDWRPVDSYNKSVEYSSLQIETPDNIKIKLKESRLNSVVEEEKVDGEIRHFWEINNYKAIESEPYSISFNEIIPKVEVSPVEFSYYGNEGKMDTWQNFGIWTNALLKERDNISEERIEFLQKLTADETDVFNKVKKVYEFLQQNTRYVSIQLGIGGFQPFSAATVDEVGYGDCKALSNYMKTMLSSIGIESFYTLVKAGRSATAIDPDFTSQAFNHVILTVPIENDTVFLECTNQFYPCGYLSDFTDDRYALMITENGGELICTKKYKEDVNTWNSRAIVEIEETGNALVTDFVMLSGLQYDFVEDELRKSKEKQIESEFKNSKISGARFIDINYEEHRHTIPVAKRKRTFEVDKLATTMGTRMFLPLNSLNKRTSVPKNRKNRKYPFKIGMAYHDMDTIVYKIPKGFDVEYLPELDSISSDFGEYYSELKIIDEQIVYIRSDLRKSGTFPPDKYPEFVSFSKDIVNADAQKIVLKKL